LEKQRKAWLNQLDPGSHFHRIFDCIPGVQFFAKDQFGRTMFVSTQAGLSKFKFEQNTQTSSHERTRDKAVYSIPWQKTSPVK
jgi:hypothetical protein